MLSEQDSCTSIITRIYTPVKYPCFSPNPETERLEYNNRQFVFYILF